MNNLKNLFFVLIMAFPLFTLAQDDNPCVLEDFDSFDEFIECLEDFYGDDVVIEIDSIGDWFDENWSDYEEGDTIILPDGSVVIVGEDFDWGDDWDDGDWDDDYDDWNDSLYFEDELAFFVENFPDCFDENVAVNSYDELYDILDNCEELNDYDDWNDSLSFEDDLAYLMEEFPDCFDENMIITNYDELYEVLENCEPFNGGLIECPDGYDDDWGDDWNDSLLFEEELEFFVNEFPECFELIDIAVTDFETLFEVLENCDAFNDWDDEDDWDEDYGLEEELEYFMEEFPSCFSTDVAITTYEELYEILENCDELNDWDDGDDWGDDWDDYEVGDTIILPDGSVVIVGEDFEWEDDEDWGDWEWTVEDELEWLSENTDLGECLEDAPEFETLDELYTYIDENCELVDDFEVDFDVEIPECLEGVDFIEDMTFQSFITTLADACAEELDIEIPACFYDAPTFDNDDDFFDWIVENCEDLEGDDIDGMLNDEGNNSAFRLYAMIPTTNVNTSGITSTENLNNNLSVNIYPNPATNVINVTSISDIELIEIIDITGRVVKTTNTTRIEISDLPLGTYIAKATSGKNISTQTFIVK